MNKTCDEIRPQLGAYVLGGLEPEEAAEVREHLARCDECAREHADLAELPAMLDLIEAPDEALQRPAPTLEESILDRHALERRALREHAARERRPEPNRRRRVRRGGAIAAQAGGTTIARRPMFGGHGRLVGAATALAAALVLAVVLLTGGGANPVNPPTAVAAELEAGPGAPRAHGTAWLHAVPAGTAVRLAAGGLPGDRSYELWCIRFDGRWVSAGTFTTASNGHANVSLTAAVRRGQYGQILVTPRTSHKPAALRGAVMGY
jgi:anti-sigma factor RsiW